MLQHLVKALIGRTSHIGNLPTFTVNGTGSSNATTTYSPTVSIASTVHLSPGFNSQSETLSTPSSYATQTPISFFGGSSKFKRGRSKAEILELKTNSLYQTSRLGTATEVHTQVSKHAKAGTWLGFNINTPYEARKEISTLAVSMALDQRKEVENDARKALVAYSDANGTHSWFTNAASHLGRSLKKGFKEDLSVEPSVKRYFTEAESEVMSRYPDALAKHKTTCSDVCSSVACDRLSMDCGVDFEAQSQCGSCCSLLALFTRVRLSLFQLHVHHCFSHTAARRQHPHA